MATFDDVRRLALALPETEEGLTHRNVAWRVRGAVFVWERPLRAADLAHLGDAAPGGTILGARVEHEMAKLAHIDAEPGVFFTTPHFDGFPAVLVQLDRIGLPALEELVETAWLVRAPRRLADAYLADRSTPTRRSSQT